ncbi:hypothetical protein EAE96_008328 [Botrytis aclada]|nr:hypothetical protein EAE96_008328 [Botrytis aclada]
MVKNRYFHFEILDSNLADSSNPILASFTPRDQDVKLFTNYREMNKQDIAPILYNDKRGRIIWCQGLSSVLDPDHDFGDENFCSFPYLSAWDPIEMTIQLHLRCSKRLGSKSANPYCDQDNGFHIVFYEKIVSRNIPVGESWKTGKLYLKTARGEVEAFRRSAFTMFTKPKQIYGRDKFELPWDFLLLTPSGFFFHTDVDIEDTDDFNDIHLRLLRDIAMQKCMPTAELTSILYAMRLVLKQWEGLYQHIEGLLHEDFMDPATYVELLFDDENFSQSRLYFWVIGCVNEFQISIEDNIKQWTLFREARVTSYFERNQGDVSRYNDSSSAYFDDLRENSQKEIKNLVKEIDVQVESLINCQSQFKHQQETAQAFRDGLFNASALMESRASTRLGENVKLLTYVSIFYLPLAFCAALWAIPNITSSGTRSPFILTTILVGFVTYMIVFNLGNIVDQSKRIYEPFKSKVIKQARRAQQTGSPSTSSLPKTPTEFESKWEKRTKRFESTFGPKKGDGEPSEWWIPIYSVIIIFKWFLVHFKTH